MSRIFLSDLHLDSATDAKYQAFRRVLNDARQAKHEVYILGDLVEVWVGDDDDAELATRLKKDLAQCSASTAVYLMPGNRDFLYRESFASATGLTLLPDPYVLERSDLANPILLAHGDAYCTSDLAYMQMRQLFRSQTWQDDILSKDLNFRRELANSLREQSKQANQLKAQNITDVDEADLCADLTQRACETMIHGHTHRPAVHRMRNGFIRYVLGDWDECGWILSQDAENFSLERFAI